MRACGTKVVLEKVKAEQERNVGGIIIPFSTNTCTRTAKAFVVSVGSDVERADERIKAGDMVLYDYYSVFGDDPAVVVTNVENVIVKVDPQDEDKFAPLGDRILTVHDKGLVPEACGGIYLPEAARKDEKWLRVVSLGEAYTGEIAVGDVVKIDPASKDFVFLMHKDIKYAIIHGEDVVCRLEP